MTARPDETGDPEIARWHHHPGAVRNNPVFDWPPNPRGVLRWYAGFWLQTSTTTLCFVMALIAYLVFLPPLEAMRNWSAGWVAQLWLINLVPHCLCAGVLHYWLFIRKGQGRQTKFDRRDQAKGKAFTFANQVHDNMFWTIASGITIWTAIQAFVFWCMANGWAPVLMHPGEAPVLFVLWFLLIPMWSSFHFYWVHRALHWPPLYRMAHALHHRNVNVGPWSGISMHPIEHLLFYTNFLIHLVVPSHPLHLIFHGYVQSVHPVFSHSGFERLVVADKDRAQMGVFFHQLHHRYFECNYGTVEMPWDRWFGSYHDGTAEASDAVRARQKRLFG